MLSGMIASATGIGGGGVTTPLMLITGLVRNVQAAPTSNAIMIFTSLSASLTYAFSPFTSAMPFSFGYIHLDYTFFLFAGSLLFSRFGYRWNKRLPLFWRKLVLGLILLILCIRIFFLLIR